MKWILTFATLCTLQVFGITKKTDSFTNPPPPPSHPELEGEPDLFNRYEQIFAGNVEFLYWGTTAGGLDYALKMRHNALDPVCYAQGRYENAKYDMSPGVRLCFLFFRALRYWEVRWQYTRMTCEGNDRSGKPDPSEQYLTGTWPQISSNPLSGAHSHIHLNYNVFDWFIDRVFFPNPHLRLRVVGGATVAWMDQDWKVRYTDSTTTATVIRNKWHFVGAGLKNGLMVDWYWTGNLYFTAHGFFGPLIGSYSNQSKQSTSNSATLVRDASYQDVRPTMTTQMLLGPSYQRNFASTRMELFAGYEMNAWFNLQEIYRSTSGTASQAKETLINSSMLALYGLTTRLSLDF